MLLDSYTLKSGLSSLLPAPAPAGFVKRVNSSFFKIETLLKTLQVRPSPPEALVQAYLIHIADRNNNNFRKILELKGIRSRQDQNHLVELFQLHRASDRYASSLQQSNPILASLQGPSAIMSAAKDGVDRFGNPSLSTLGAGVSGSTGTATSASGVTSPSGALSPSLTSSTLQSNSIHTPTESATGNLNENLKNIGKFFRRDLGGFGGRFGRSTEDGA